jgi:parallel beta-helix repeat protein
MAHPGVQVVVCKRRAGLIEQIVNPVRLSKVGLMGLLIAAGAVAFLSDRSVSLAETKPSIEVAQIPYGASVIHVNPGAGTDTPGAGNQATPYRSITYALQNAQAGTVVQLERGSYIQETGEAFPLRIPPGVVLRGEEGAKGQTVAIIGGGILISPTFARQNVTILAGKDSEIRGVSVLNPNLRGTGIWVESTNPTIKNCTFSKNHREGVFITGTGNPKVEGNVFTQNGGNGLSIASNARGEIRDNVFQNTGFGLAIGGNSAPLVTGNQITQNTDGIYINDSARPILRNNVIAKNNRDGLVATIRANPDLGTAESSGNNTIQDNRQYDLNNATGGTLYSVGNTLEPTRVAGRVEFTSQGGQISAFRDVQGHWAKAYIEALAKRNIISGFPNGTFRPEERVTRVQFAAIVNKAFTPAAKRSRTEFRDVSSSFWGYEAIQSAVQGGFLKGYPEGAFKPEQPIPRVQALVALATGLGFNPGSTTTLSTYQDAAQIPSWATGSVATATQRRIVVNYPTLTQLNPNREATRAEVAAFVYQALVNAGKAEPIPSPYIVGG